MLLPVQPTVPICWPPTDACRRRRRRCRSGGSTRSRCRPRGSGWSGCRRRRRTPVSVIMPLATATIGVPEAVREVEAGVVAGPEAAGHAEAGGQAVAAGGQVPLVLGDLAGAGLGGLAEGLELGVALGGLLLGGLLELTLGGVLHGLALGVAADRPLAGVAGEPDGVGAGQRGGAGGDLDGARSVGGAGCRRSRRRRRRATSATTPTRVGMAGASREAQLDAGQRLAAGPLGPSAALHRGGADQQDDACCGALPGGYP